MVIDIFCSWFPFPNDFYDKLKIQIQYFFASFELQFGHNVGGLFTRVPDE